MFDPPNAVAKTRHRGVLKSLFLETEPLSLTCSAAHISSNAEFYHCTSFFLCSLCWFILHSPLCVIQRRLWLQNDTIQTTERRNYSEIKPVPFFQWSNIFIEYQHNSQLMETSLHFCQALFLSRRTPQQTTKTLGAHRPLRPTQVSPQHDENVFEVKEENSLRSSMVGVQANLC